MQFRWLLLPGVLGQNIGFDGDGCVCPCDPSRDGKCPESEQERMKPEFCYKPVCEPGYYRCCSTCAMSVCANKFPMVKSRRGIFECIECIEGGYCPGCDIRIPCPDDWANNQRKMQELQDCELCAFDEVGNRAEAEGGATECCAIGDDVCTRRKKRNGMEAVGMLLLLFLAS